jgi:hypothetical protein
MTSGASYLLPERRNLRRHRFNQQKEEKDSPRDSSICWHFLANLTSSNRAQLEKPA